MDQSMAQWRVSTVAGLRHLKVQRSATQLSMACSLLLEEISSQHILLYLLCLQRRRP